MSDKLTIVADWEHLDVGSPEERAAFAAIGIQFGDLWLTEAEDTFVKRVRQQVHLSGYHLAEWFAWNWWRLRWEPRRPSVDWRMTHRMSTIGGGYVWPNITILSDGERICFDTKPTASRASEPLHYITSLALVMRASDFEAAVDAFINQVLGQLREKDLPDSNLKIIWADVLSERATPDVASRRKLEALLGLDADEADKSLIEQMIQDGKVLGARAIEELAADGNGAKMPVTPSDINGLARDLGLDANPRDVVHLQVRNREALPTNVEAWKRGVAAARALRNQEGLHDGPISNERLCELMGVSSKAVSRDQKTGPISFVFDEGQEKGAIVLRSKYETGRRFDLARLLGDRIAAPMIERLKPATRSYTYRQKLQRAFAGEFLCPFDALADLLGGDLSADAREDAASHFNVSERTVSSLLVNHKMIGREELDFDLVA